MNTLDARLQRWLEYTLIAFAATLPLSIALVQPPAYAAIILFLILFVRNRRSMAIPATSLGWPIALFLATVVLASALGFRAAMDFIRVPVLVSMGTPLFHTGNMRDPQLYMTGLCLAAGMLSMGAWRLTYPPAAVSLLFSLGGLVIHFKRGAWVSAIIALMAMAAWSRRWRLLAVVLLSSSLILLIPSVQDRLALLHREFDAASGGRMLLWTGIAPQLIPDHPFGMGWRAVKHEDFVAVSPHVEKDLKHLHNNVLQVALELGYAGLAGWFVWMGAALFLFYRIFRDARASGVRESAGMALGLAGAFTGLLVNGLVEYNFGDSEIFMLMILLMGIGAGLQHLRESPVP